MAEVGRNLSCSVCYEPFKTPKVLSCGHTYCLHCVDRLVDRRRYTPTLQCPTCRRQVDFPPSGETEDLITNFQLQSMVEQRIEELKRAAGSSRKRPRVGSSQSNECPLHKLPKELYCRSCKAPICTECTLAEHDVGEHDIVRKSKHLEDQKKKYAELRGELPNIDSIHRRLKEEVELRTRMLLDEKRWMQDRIQQTLERKQNQLRESARELEQELDEGCSSQEGNDFLFKVRRQQNQLKRVQEDSESIQGELDADEYPTTCRMDAFFEDLRRLTSELVALAGSVEALPYMSPQVYQDAGDLPVSVGSLRRNPDMGDMERHYRSAFLIDDATKVHMKI